MTMDEYYSWFIKNAVPAAIASGHVWPEMAVAEALEESTDCTNGDYHLSELAAKYNNLFGLKDGEFTHNLPSVELPTHEWVQGKGFVATTAQWPIFKNWQQAFHYRMVVLTGLSHEFPHYEAALTAKSPTDYIKEVSQTWSTDPDRAKNVLNIYWKWHDLLYQTALPLEAKETEDNVRNVPTTSGAK